VVDGERPLKFIPEIVPIGKFIISLCFYLKAFPKRIQKEPN
jgi:hypothetical protein